MTTKKTAAQWRAMGYTLYRVYSGRRFSIVGLGSSADVEESRTVWRKLEDLDDLQDRGNSEYDFYECTLSA